MAKLLGQLSGSACASRAGEHKHRVFPSQLQSLLELPACLKKTCYHWCDTDSVQESTRF